MSGMSKKHWTYPRWVSDGETVWLRWDERKGSALRCTVACAAGDHARVVNEDRGVDKWVRLTDDLVVPPEDPRGADSWGWRAVLEGEGAGSCDEASHDRLKLSPEWERLGLIGIVQCGLVTDMPHEMKNCPRCFSTLVKLIVPAGHDLVKSLETFWVRREGLDVVGTR